MANARKITSNENEAFTKMLERLHRKQKTKEINKLRCVIYARKSTEDLSGSSLEAQIEFCNELINSSDLLEVVGIYQEDDVSGFHYTQRPEFNKIMEMAISREIDVIVCHAWDRFSRNMGETQMLTGKFADCNVYVLTGDDIGAEKSAQAHMIQQMQWMFAENMVRTTAEKTKNEMICKAKKGNHMSGAAPLGYNRVKKISKLDKNELEINTEESIIVSLIFEKIASGYTLRSVAKMLNNLSYKTKKRK